MYKILIIDDERRALNILKILIEKHLDDVGLVETALGPESGIQKFRSVHPDLVFLDIEMPGMTGFEYLQHIREINPGINVIFTTAYDHYAIKAIRFSAIDYLLKPIDIEELKMAYHRFVTAQQSTQKDMDHLISNLMSNLQTIHIRKPRLAVATQGGAVFFDIDDIIRCEADNNYTVFYVDDAQKFVASRTLKEYDSLLHEYAFLRVHQSHLVNPAYIKEYTQKGMLELTDGSYVPVARRKHQWLHARLREMYH